MGEKKTFTCPNVSCKKKFTNPLKTLNLQETPSEPYYACPFCLSKIEWSELKIQEKPSQLEAPPKQAITVPEQDSSKSNEKPAACQFHLGYLSERTQKEIPENCLVCKDIVECMLRKCGER